MEKIKVAVIGAGNMGKNHIRIYSEMNNVELIGVVDLNDKIGKEIANKFNTNYFSDYKEVVDKVNAVSIVVPTKFHYGIAKEFLNSGVDVLIEKPITINLNEADEIIGLADKNKLILQVGHVERFNPAIIELSKYIKPDEIISIDASRIGPFGARITDSGVVLDLMIHDIDIILSLMKDEIASINAYGRNIKGNYADYAAASIKFKNGIIANLTASRITQRRQRTLKITETEKYMKVDYMNKILEIYRQSQAKYVTNDNDVKFIYSDVVERPYISQEEPLKLELQSFVECVKSRKNPVVDGIAGRKALDVALKILDEIDKNK
ncbi:Similar to 1-carboxy-3-chloro-3,4-dihydroxycyclohexa-1, 5-diene dehydrogenase [groundwater metagenome]|uniref:Similar to 1-carboxy-3-chloro-3,4-dihydroxycyclohexa-1, 5-diene dehydrogenase n=1 Tax=groundwater metagenome TaxID=717931 RepID=A0A098EBK7_9ZZZZ